MESAKPCRHLEVRRGFVHEALLAVGILAVFVFTMLVAVRVSRPAQTGGNTTAGSLMQSEAGGAAVQVSVPEEITPGSQTMVSWRYSRGSPTAYDWIVIVPYGYTWAGAGGSAYWLFWDGTAQAPTTIAPAQGFVIFSAPARAGKYWALYYRNGSSADQNLVGRSGAFTVQ